MVGWGQVIDSLLPLAYCLTNGYVLAVLDWEVGESDKRKSLKQLKGTEY